MGAVASAVNQKPLLLRRLAEARVRTDELFAMVRPDSLYERPLPERHRIIFYLGHLEAFDWNLLGREHFELPPFAPSLDQLFAFGIDPVDGGLPSDQPRDWPGRADVARYGQMVRQALDERLAAEDRASGTRLAHTAQRLHVAIEHRLMHAETLTYMLHQLPLDRKHRQQGLRSPSAAPHRPHMVEIPAGSATLGLPRSDSGAFGWDNEFEEHAVSVPAFRMDAYNVTHGEFLRFIEEGGYRERSFWREADWQWLQSSGISRPVFWIRRGADFFYRTMFDEVPLLLDWPVYVSHAEASAYARWAGKQLPSEAEWHRAAYGTREGAERDYPWGGESPDSTRGNFDDNRWDPTPAGAFPAGASAFGVCDLLGNGWEWTRTPFEPFKGFEPFSFYPGYSANFFDHQHFVMKGGSARTAACMLRRSFRNWFQQHYPYVYASFRCVEY